LSADRGLIEHTLIDQDAFVFVNCGLADRAKDCVERLGVLFGKAQAGQPTRTKHQNANQACVCVSQQPEARSSLPGDLITDLAPWAC
jgi:hypothetical protein